MHLPRHLSSDTVGKLGDVCECRPRSGIALRISESLGLDYYEIEGVELFGPYRKIIRPIGYWYSAHQGIRAK